MTEIGTYLAATGAVIAAIVRCRSRPREQSLRRRYLIIVLSGLSLSLLLDLPSIQVSVADLTGEPYLGRWLANVTAMTATFSAVAMVSRPTLETVPALSSHERWWAASGLLVVVATAWILLVSTDASLEHDLPALLATQHEIAVAQGSYWLYMSVCVTRFLFLIRPYLVRPDVWSVMHQGMAMMAVAAVVGAIWLGWSGGITLVQRLSGQIASDSENVLRSLDSVAVGLVALGLLLPLWTRWMRAVRIQWTCRLLLRRLRPLWTESVELVPDVMMAQPFQKHSYDVALYRRVIEIRDAQLRIAGYVQPGVDELMCTVDRESMDDRHGYSVRLTAARLAIAMSNYRADRRTEGIAKIDAADAPIADTLVEARWLIAVDRCKRSCPAVAQVVQLAS